MTSTTVPKKWKNFRSPPSPAEKSKGCEEVQSNNESCSYEDTEHSEFPAKRQRMSIGDSDQEASHHWLCYGMTDKMMA